MRTPVTGGPVFQELVSGICGVGGVTTSSMDWTAASWLSLWPLACE